MERSEIVAPYSPDMEARQATVLKCDVVGSTRIKKQLDLEGQIAFRRGFEQIVIGVATRYGAHIQKFEGDAALMVFGSPQAREDASESAVRTGLALVDAFQKSEILPGVRLQLRVGIASGEVAAANDPPGPGAEPIAGLTIDVAERLRAAAEPDQVFIEDETKDLAGGFFFYDDLGAVQAKGFDDGLRAWRVLGESPVVSRFEAQRFDESRGEIFGRADVLACLSEAWTSSLGGHGQAVCLEGEAGIGKSRLARAALDAAARDDAATLRIDCTPSTGNTPLFPVGVLLRRIANITPACSEAEKRTLAQQLLAQRLPAGDVPSALTYLAPLFGLKSVALPMDVGPDELREKTISTVVRLLRSLTAEGPVAMLCEDLHWVDDMTAKVLARVCEEIAGLRALLIVTTRPPPDKPPLDLSKFIKRVLPRLDSSMAVDLVRSVAKGAALSDEVVRGIVDRCEGVPLVLEEVTRSALHAAGRPDETGHARPDLDGQVPAPLQLVVQSRLGRWPRFAPIVKAASVLGREFPVRLIEKLVPGVRQSDVEKAIDVLAREGLFVERDSSRDRARFKHIMICEAVYNTLLRKAREDLHSRIADILSGDEKGTPDAAPDVIAGHLGKAARFGEAIEVRYAASGEMLARGAYVDAQGHCRAALALIGNLEDPEDRRKEELRLQLRLAVALTGEQGYSATDVENAYERARALCGDSVDDLYQVMRGLATVNLVRGYLATAYDLSTQALDLAEQSNRAEFRIDAMSVLCYTTLYYKRLEDCRTWIDRCLGLYRKEHGKSLTYPVPQDAATAAMALLPTVAWLLGDSQAAEDAIQKGIDHVEDLDRNFDRALMHAWIAGARYTQRRYVQASQHAGTAVGISQKHSYREWHGIGVLVASIAQAALDANPQAVAQAKAVCDAFAGQGVGLNASYYLWGLARGHARAGDAQTAAQMLAGAFGLAQASRETRMNAELLMLQAELETDDASAKLLLVRALAIADEQGAVATALRAAAAIALRSKADNTLTEYARATLDMLDGRSPYPAQRDWMQERSAALRRTLDASAVAAARA